MYDVGHKIVNPDSGDAFVFAGYDEVGEERWCAIIPAPWGAEALSEPVTQQFEGFNGPETLWSMSEEDYAEQIDQESKPN